VKRRLTIVFFDAGGGHRSAAEALKSVLESQDRPWKVQLLNLQRELDKLDVLRKLTRIRIQDGYNLMLRRGWTRLAPALLPVLQATIRLHHRPTVRLLTAYWKQNPTDLVLSVIPHFNRAIAESVRRAECAPPFVTLLTDLADYPPHFWMERQDQHFICGSDRAVRQARELGHPAEKVHQVSGMILNPRFYEIPPLTADERAARRKELGFDPSRPVGLVLFGGQGAKVMLEIAERLDGLQLLMICGHNAKLAGRLRELRRSAPMFIEGFTKEVPRYMQVADYFIGKPGPGSISEAVAMGLPVIVERNAWTLPQERYNADWIREKGIGIVLQNFRGIAQAVDRLLDPADFERYRAATRRIENRAVFEIPEILERIAG